ncbi:TonB family protein [Spirosoma lacussanchae]|uniref:energy transducer TonB n=1 Tax=Spirosoma lacussanchae TaxID=1884249 RepID=UPI0014873E03|nr:energy transducer TonB [Spirosoma lacussanchae]
MKTISLLAGCLSLFTSVATAQLPDPVLSAAADNVTGVIAPAPESVTYTQSTDEFVPVTNEPFFPGGHQALEAYFQNPAFYPHQAQQAGIEGTVHVRFRVTSMGHLTDLKVVKSRGSLLDSAALKAVAQMPRWYPAHRSGIAVSSVYVLPVTFRAQ